MRCYEVDARKFANEPNPWRNPAAQVDARKFAKEATKEAVRQIPREIRRTDEIDENTFAKALLTAIIGVLTGLAATWVQFFGVFLLYNPKMDLVEGLVAGNNILSGFMAHFIISTIMSVGAAVLVVFVAPSATGAGFAEIKVSANGALYAKNTDDPKVIGTISLMCSLPSTLDPPEKVLLRALT